MVLDSFVNEGHRDRNDSRNNDDYYNPIYDLNWKEKWKINIKMIIQ